MEYFLMAVLIVSADMISKYLVNRKIKENSNIEVVPDKVYITNIKNSGAAGGLLKDNAVLLNLLSFVSLGNIIKITLSLIKREEKSFLYKLSLTCMIGGALGNITERLSKKKVTDFIFFKYKTQTISPKYKGNLKSTPVFNIADLFIVFGIGIFVFRSLFSKKK